MLGCHGCGVCGGCVMGGVFVVDVCKTILMFSLAQAERLISFRIHRSSLIIDDHLVTSDKCPGILGLYFPQ